MIELLKFITCGSVDDGKSTLIGHMLYNAKLLFADQKRALELDSRLGANGGEMDYSLLLDGLMAEREQGITIDVAYRYFTTDRRSFIVADTPGHEEYTRNMAVGASFADLSVILVDACHGVLTQTRRHARICALMGIRCFVFAVNKMDLVDYDQRRFRKLSKDIRVLMAEFEPDSLVIIPLSATKGDNITERSSAMPWYRGPTLLQHLETVDVSRQEEGAPFVLPIQRVCRPDSRFRGFQGQIASGSVRVGDLLTARPSGEQARVKAILEGNRPVSGSSEGRAVTLQLDREIDLSRGDVLEQEAFVLTGSQFMVHLLWMDDVPLTEGKSYLLKLGTQTIGAVVVSIHHKVDVNTGSEVNAQRIWKNELAFCHLATGSPIVFQTFENSRDLGALILIDRLSDQTAACGVIAYSLEGERRLTWQTMDVTRQLRETQLGQRAITVWLTGLSGAGKSTIANELEKRLVALGRHSMLLDGDNLRHGLNRDLGFGQKDRIENIRRVAEVAHLMNEAGLIVLTAFISPLRQDRRRAREVIGDCFVEVFVNTPLEECERRDVKGLYRAARAGELSNFTGISSPYEPPEAPELTVNTLENTVEECAQIILRYLERRIAEHTEETQP